MAKFGGPPVGGGGPKTSPQLKPQEQDSPTSTIGRFGVFRALMHEQTPKLRVLNPVTLGFGGGPAFLKRGGGY